MTPAAFLRELLYPLTHTGLAVTVVVFALLLQLALAAGLLGLWLLVIAGAAAAKFLVLLLRARALGTEPPVPDSELFNPLSSLWTLGAWLLLLLLPAVAATARDALGIMAGLLVLAGGLFLYPAAALRLAVTMSVGRMLAPVALVETIRRTGAGYLLIFGGVGLIMAVTGVVAGIAGPLSAGVERLGAGYALVLFFSLAGAVFHHRRLALELPVIDSPERREERARRYRERDRRAVLDHAYAHVSRGNGHAGIAYILDWLARAEAGREAWAWFFERLWEWESPRAAVHFGRDYVSALLEWGEDGEALHVCRRCRRAAADFRPPAADRPALAEAARRLGDREMQTMLRQAEGD